MKTNRTVEDYLNLPYKIVWEVDFSKWTRETKEAYLTCYLREIPEVQGCATTAAGALSDLRNEFAAYLTAALEEGRKVVLPLDMAALDG